MTDDLVRRLRCLHFTTLTDDFRDAAERLEQLEREVSTLREQRDAAECELERANEQLAEIRAAWGFRIEH